MYIQLESIKFGKTKKEKYKEISKRLKVPVNTIISWIRRYLEDYRTYLKELEIKINAQICDFEGLTEKQTKYVIARLYGKNTEEAKQEAGYSENTKAADIEKHPAVATKLHLLRQKLFLDSKLGAERLANELLEISKKGEQGIEIVETTYEDENSQKFGHRTFKAVKKRREYNLSAARAAIDSIRAMLGYDWAEEQRVIALLTKKTEDDNQDDVVVSDEDFK
ncbi:helix-turn-helix domain-containing protein [Fusobacterium hominis]|uniref:Helix-turn-helix domain-containing protein n=1 Tax=Fusobacterium hominis TaxID=2764326 RepID=A0A7G9GXH1_9FUSO|nr:helix-turn-helix domain-containing protein [Fusobacterium hominis]QNM15503.1 helix-turn-helix domain-containing protein [Fusobacterium hominis]